MKDIQLHGFGDASKAGICTAIYVVASDGVETTQGLVTSNTGTCHIKGESGKKEPDHT